MNQNVFALNVLKGNVCGVGQSLGAVSRSVQAGVGNRAEYLVFQFVAQSFEAFVLVEGSCQFARCSETHNTGNSRRAGASPTLLSTANNKRRELNAFANVKRADALR